MAQILIYDNSLLKDSETVEYLKSTDNQESTNISPQTMRFGGLSMARVSSSIDREPASMTKNLTSLK